AGRAGRHREQPARRPRLPALPLEPLRAALARAAHPRPPRPPDGPVVRRHGRDPGRREEPGRGRVPPARRAAGRGRGPRDAAARRPPAVPALDRVLAVTGDESAGATGAAVLHLAYYHLARRVFGVRLGDDLAHRWMGCVNLMDAPLLRAFSDPESPWAKPAVR